MLNQDLPNACNCDIKLTTIKTVFAGDNLIKCKKLHLLSEAYMRTGRDSNPRPPP